VVAGRPFLASDWNLAERVVRADSTWRATAVIDSTVESVTEKTARTNVRAAGSGRREGVS